MKGIPNSKVGSGKGANSNLIVGLTGGMAAGKSSVARIFRKLGAIVIDADLIARRVVQPKTRAWQEIVACFGQEVLNPDLSINRKIIAELIFSRQSLRQRLNEITHPVIKTEIEKEIEKTMGSQSGQKIIIIDAPLLIEAGMTSMTGKLVVVTASEKTQTERIMKRDGLNAEAAKSRISAQMPLKEKIPLADFVITNDGSKKELEEKTRQVWDKLIWFLPIFCS